MKIRTEQDLSCEDIEITIKYSQKDKRLTRIIEYLQSYDAHIKYSVDNTEQMINIADIYYIESVDKKTFVYLEKEVYHIDLRLYQLKEKLQNFGFVQISKSCLLNINVMKSIRPLLNSRMEATLNNGEKVYVSRKYLDEVKKALRNEETP